jgi:hypothetical protein
MDKKEKAHLHWFVANKPGSGIILECIETRSHGLANQYVANTCTSTQLHARVVVAPKLWTGSDEPFQYALDLLSAQRHAQDLGPASFLIPAREYHLMV